MISPEYIYIYLLIYIIYVACFVNACSPLRLAVSFDEMTMERDIYIHVYVQVCAIFTFLLYNIYVANTHPVTNHGCYW